MNRHLTWLCMGSLVGALACSADQLPMGTEPGQDSGADLPTGADAADPGLGTATLAADATELAFGTVALGLSSVKSLILSNTGQASSGALALSSSNQAFVIRTGATGDCVSGQELAAGASCTVAVVFTPSASDDRSGTLTYSATPGGSGSIALSGSGKPGRLSVLAGVPSGQGTTDGIGSAARLGFPYDVAIDQAGTLFIIDRAGIIRKITPAGAVTTLALHAETGASTGSDQGLPYGPLVVDRSGNIFMSDGYGAIWKITPNGATTVFAGQSNAKGGQNGTGSAALFNDPEDLVVDAAGNLFVADSMNSVIRKITPEGVVTTYAGTLGTSGNKDGPIADARFDAPTAMAMDASGNIFVFDGSLSSAKIRKISPAGVVTTIKTSKVQAALAIAVDGAGNLFLTDNLSKAVHKISNTGVESVFAGQPELMGGVDATGTAARFQYPAGLAIDASGDLYVVDRMNNAIRKITPAGVVTTFVGSLSAPGSDDGPGDKARFRFSIGDMGVAWDGAGNLFAADFGNHTIRKITPAGVVTTFAGTPGAIGSDDGTGADASFFQPSGLAVDKAGNLYVADTLNHTVRKITPTGTVTTLAGSPGSNGHADGQGAAASFWSPQGIAVDGAGNLFVTDVINATIRRITPAGVVTTPFGMVGDSRIVDGSGTKARFERPTGITIDGTGNLYVTEQVGNAIRKITPAGVVTTLAGAGTPDRGSADGTGAAALFAGPSGVTVDGAGNVFVADVVNNAIRRITPEGVVSTFAGVLSFTSQGNFPGPLPASMVKPAGVAINPATGTLAIALVDAILTVGP